MRLDPLDRDARIRLDDARAAGEARAGPAVAKKLEHSQLVQPVLDLWQKLLDHEVLVRPTYAAVRSTGCRSSAGRTGCRSRARSALQVGRAPRCGVRATRAGRGSEARRARRRSVSRSRRAVCWASSSPSPLSPLVGLVGAETCDITLRKYASSCCSGEWSSGGDVSRKVRLRALFPDAKESMHVR
jgi:hypothetical protein